MQQVNKQRVLMVEDDHIWGDLLVESLTNRGYKVSWFVRAKIVGENELNLMDIDGILSPFRAADFDLALVDGKLRCSDLDGPSLTPLMVAAGLPVIAISGAGFFNEQMVKLGAKRAVSKYDLLMAVIDDASCLCA
jgi:DNA-binding response OmpR family regulator